MLRSQRSVLNTYRRGTLKKKLKVSPSPPPNQALVKKVFIVYDRNNISLSHIIQILQNTVHDPGHADADGRAVRPLGGNPVERVLRVFPVPTDHGPELDLAGEQCRSSVRQQTIHRVSTIHILKTYIIISYRFHTYILSRHCTYLCHAVAVRLL